MDRVELAVINELNQMQMPKHFKGYQFIKAAVQVVYNHPSNSFPAITKEVYPAVAKEFNTEPKRVERGIRHAIEQTGKEGICNFLHIKSGWLTNSSFLIALAEKIRIELETGATDMEITSSYTPKIKIDGDLSILK